MYLFKWESEHTNMKLYKEDLDQAAHLVRVRVFQFTYSMIPGNSNSKQKQILFDFIKFKYSLFAPGFMSLFKPIATRRYVKI